MKFGKRLHRAATSFTSPQYAAHLLDYKALKKLIKKLTVHRSYRSHVVNGTPSHNASIANTSPSLSSSSSSPNLSSRTLLPRPLSHASPHLPDELSKQLAASSLSATSSSASSASSSSPSTSSASLSITIPASHSQQLLHRVNSSPDSSLSTPSPSPPSSAHPFSPPLDDGGVDTAVLAKEFMMALEAELVKINSFYCHVVASLVQQVAVLRQSLPRTGDLSSLSDVCEQMSQLRKFIVLNYLGVIKIVKKHDKNAAHPVADRMIPHLYAQPFYHSLQVAQLYTEVDSMSRMGMKSVRRDDFNCPICGDLLECPVVLSCSHRFCWKCLSRAASNSAMDDCCPVCMKPQLLDPSNYIIDDLLLQFIRTNFPKKGHSNLQLPPSSPYKVTEVHSPKRETQFVGVRRGSADDAVRSVDDSAGQPPSSSSSPTATATAMFSAALSASLSAYTSSSSSHSPLPPAFLFSPPTFLRSHSPTEDSTSSFQSSNAPSGPFHPGQHQSFDSSRGDGGAGNAVQGQHLELPQQQTSSSQRFSSELSPFLLSSSSPTLSPSPALPMDFHLDPSQSPPHPHHRLSTRPWQTNAGTGDKFLLPWLPEDEEDQDVCADVQHEPVNLGYHWPSYHSFYTHDEDAIERETMPYSTHPRSPDLQRIVVSPQQPEDYPMAQDDDERLHNSTSPLSSSSASSSEHSLTSSDLMALTSMNHLFMNDEQQHASHAASDMDHQPQLAMSPSTDFLTPPNPSDPRSTRPPSSKPPGPDNASENILNQLEANLAEAMRAQHTKSSPVIHAQAQSYPSSHGHSPVGPVLDRKASHPRSNSLHSNDSSNSSQASHSPDVRRSAYRSQTSGPVDDEHPGGYQWQQAVDVTQDAGQHPTQQPQLFASSSDFHQFHGAASSAPSSSPSPLSHFSPPSGSRRATSTNGTSAGGAASNSALTSPSHRPFPTSILPPVAPLAPPSQPHQQGQSRSLLHQKHPLPIATSGVLPFNYSVSAPSSPQHPAPPSATFHHHMFPLNVSQAVHPASGGLSSPHSAHSTSSVASRDSHSGYQSSRVNGVSELEQVTGGSYATSMQQGGHATHGDSAANAHLQRAASLGSVTPSASPYPHYQSQPSTPSHGMENSPSFPPHLSQLQGLNVQIPPNPTHPSHVSSHHPPGLSQPHTQHHIDGTTTLWVPIQVSNVQAASVQSSPHMGQTEPADEDSHEKAESAHPVTLLQMQSPSHSSLSSSSPPNATSPPNSGNSSNPLSPTGSQPSEPLTPAHVLTRPFVRRVPRFLCQHPGCSDGFNTRFSLKRHLKMHTGEKPYPCTQCPKSFAEKSTLVRHLRIHTGERPFQCTWPNCTRSFSDRTNVRRHETQHEQQKDLPIEEQTAMMSEEQERLILKKREQEVLAKKKAERLQAASDAAAAVAAEKREKEKVKVKQEEEQQLQMSEDMRSVFMQR